MKANREIHHTWQPLLPDCERALKFLSLRACATIVSKRDNNVALASSIKLLLSAGKDLRDKASCVRCSTAAASAFDNYPHKD